MIKEVITTPQAITLAVMAFSMGLCATVTSKAVLTVIKIVWVISLIVLWVLM